MSKCKVIYKVAMLTSPITWGNGTLEISDIENYLEPG